MPLSTVPLCRLRSASCCASDTLLMSVRTCRAASTGPWQGSRHSSVEVATPERRAEESVPGRAYASPASPRTGDRGSRSTALELQATRIMTSSACWRAPGTECFICWSLDKRHHEMGQSLERRRMTATGPLAEESLLTSILITILIAYQICMSSLLISGKVDEIASFRP